MYAYLLLILTIVLLYIILIGKERKKEKLFICLSFLALFLFAAIRSENSGIDLPNYKFLFYNYTPLNIIDQINSKYVNSEIGYLLYSKFIYIISNGSFRVLLITTAFISYYGVFKFIEKYSSNKLLSIIIYICIGYYSATLSGLRQCIAISIICMGYNYIINRDFKKFLITIIIASLFHKSALIFLPAFLLYNFKMENIKSIICFSLIPILFALRNIIVYIFESNFYKEYDLISNSGGGYTLLLIYIILFIIITMYKKPFLKNDITNNMFYNFFYIGILIQILATVEGNAFRASKYYLICLTCLLPNLVNIFSKEAKIIINILIFVLLIIYFIYNNQNLVYGTIF